MRGNAPRQNNRPALPLPSVTSEVFPAAELLPALLDATPAGAALLLPVRDAAGELVDVRLGYLNPAARQLLALPAPTAPPSRTFTSTSPARPAMTKPGSLTAS